MVFFIGHIDKFSVFYLNSIYPGLCIIYFIWLSQVYKRNKTESFMYLLDQVTEVVGVCFNGSLFGKCLIETDKCIWEILQLLES